MSGGHNKSCGTAEAVIFIFALIGGTCCSLTSKVMLNMKGVGMTGEMENFSYPLFQTFGMFLGMTAALIMHYLVLQFRIPFPGYTHATTDDEDVVSGGKSPASTMKPTPMWMYFVLIVPAVFDLIATCLAMFGLRHVNVSIYQMLRGSAIIFVAILKQFVLGHPLQRYKWIGIGYNVISIVLVGLTAMLTSGESNGVEGGAEGSTSGEGGFKQDPLLGVFLIICGAFVQSLQYAFEERVMTTTENEDVPPTPPLLLIGMEGFWGSVICIFILYPIALYIPGSDHGCFENIFNTIYMITHNAPLQHIFTIYFFSILLYNILAVLVTFMLDSVWHAILDNFRPVTVWGVDLFIFYVLTTSFGESWSTAWSWLQLLGMVILLYGTAIYNAPNAGSLQLLGDWTSCFIDCHEEYPLSEQALNDEELCHLKTSTDANNTPTTVGNNPFRESMSPLLMMSPQANNRRQERAKSAAIPSGNTATVLMTAIPPASSQQQQQLQQPLHSHGYVQAHIYTSNKPSASTNAGYGTK